MYTRSFTERNKALYSWKNHSCLIWKSEGASFIKTVEEIKFKDFEMISDVFNGEYKQTTAMRIENSEHYELWIIDIDVEYDANEFLITGYIYILITPERKKAMRPAHGIGTNCEEGTVEAIGKNCYVRTSG